MCYSYTDMSDTLKVNTTLEESDAVQPDSPSGSESGDPTMPTDRDDGASMETPDENGQKDEKLFPSDPMISNSITKSQMDTLHNQMRRFKHLNQRHGVIKAKLLAEAAQDPFYPHRSLFFLGPQTTHEGMIGINMKVCLT